MPTNCLSVFETRAKETIESNLSNNDPTSPEDQLHNLRLKNPNRLIFAHLNINSLRNKFDLLANIVKDKTDILMISETKLDRNGNGGGILVFIREDIPFKLIESQMKIEGFFIELNLKRKKWLLCCSYNPRFSQRSFHFR